MRQSGCYRPPPCLRQRERGLYCIMNACSKAIPITWVMWKYAKRNDYEKWGLKKNYGVNVFRVKEQFILNQHKRHPCQKLPYAFKCSKLCDHSSSSHFLYGKISRKNKLLMQFLLYSTSPKTSLSLELSKLPLTSTYIPRTSLPIWPVMEKQIKRTSASSPYCSEHCTLITSLMIWQS